MKTNELKYEYHLFTWGGFYSDEYFKIHQKPSGDFWFKTEEERQTFIDELRTIEKELNAKHLLMYLSEGYCCRMRTVLHRVVEWNGERYYTSNDLGINYHGAEFILEYKWCLGFNDYPLGEDFDYDNNDVTIIQEWITGPVQQFEFDKRSLYGKRTS